MEGGNGVWRFLGRGLAWVPAIAWAGLIFFVSSQPKETFVKLGLSGTLLSVAGHLVTYAVLMVLLVIALREGGRLPAKQSYLVAFLLVALYGLSDEYHQSFVPGRTATLWDWLVDLLGAGLAWAALIRWEQRRRR
jgi:VanZ family protein